MNKIIICLLVYTLLLVNELVESHIQSSKIGISSRFGDAELAVCAENEECILHNQCDEVNKLTRKRYLTKEERLHLRGKLCKFYKNEHHFCCKKKEKKLQLPEVPVCGLYFSDRVSITLSNSFRSFYDQLSDNLQIYSTSEDTYIDQYPWTAMIMYSKPGNKIGKQILDFEFKPLNFIG